LFAGARVDRPGLAATFAAHLPTLDKDMYRPGRSCWRNMVDEKESNIARIKEHFLRELEQVGYAGVLGVASFGTVYRELMPVQGRRLEELCGDEFQVHMERGSIICIGTAYPDHVIDCIGAESGGAPDKNTWNVYARAYREMNGVLNMISMKVAGRFGGSAIPATLGGLAKEVDNVNEYDKMTISHRVVAENAGLGWRGRNELVINQRYGCALRFASVITSLPLPYSEKLPFMCGGCGACLEVCSFLRNKRKLKDYRENCRRFINALGLEEEVCGKCISACLRRGIFKDQFRLPSSTDRQGVGLQ